MEKFENVSIAIDFPLFSSSSTFFPSKMVYQFKVPSIIVQKKVKFFQTNFSFYFSTLIENGKSF